MKGVSKLEDNVGVKYPANPGTVEMNIRKNKQISHRYVLEDLMADCAKSERPTDAWAGLIRDEINP